MTALYVAGILASAWLGQLVLRREAGDIRTFLLALLVGQLVLRVVKPLPWIGGLTGFVVLLLGLGLVVAASRAVHAQLRARS